MKKLFILVFSFFVAVTFLGCENATKISLASFSNMTSAGSENYTVKISFQSDTRFQEKYYDVQIMSDTEDVELVFWKEGEDKLTSTLTEKNVWNSLTSLKVSAAGLEGQEDFSQLKDAVNEIYIFNVNKPCKLIFRVVAGQISENSDKTGLIIANTEPISNDFVLNCA